MKLHITKGGASATMVPKIFNETTIQRAKITATNQSNAV
jgi:hypothetical protein